MITKLEIINFRNIKNQILHFNSRTSIITGQNNLGKSNSLNALNWLLTDTLLTDKYGSGENDTQSIIPIKHHKGEHTAVTITLDSGTEYTKILKRGYDKITGKPNKHTTEYLINGSAVNTKDAFLTTLFTQLNFNKCFTALKVDELRLNTDPLYALLKLDYKDLRKLLVAMGCTVSNEELYQKGFRDLQIYEQKYLGRWDDMRKALKDTSKKHQTQIQQIEAQLRLFSDLEDNYNESALKDLKARREELLEDKNKLLNAGNSYLVLDLDKEISNLENELNQKINARKTELNNAIAKINLDIANVSSNFESEKYKATSLIQASIDKLRNKLADLKEQLANLNLERGSLERNIGMNDINIKGFETSKDAKAEMLGKILNEKNEMVCPICGSTFEVDVEEHQKEIMDLSNKIALLDEDILNLQTENGTLKEKMQVVNDNIENIKNEIKDYEKMLSDEMFEKEKTIRELASPESKIKELETEKNELRNKYNFVFNEFEQEQNQIDDLKAKKQSIIIESEEAVKKELEQVNYELNELDKEMSQEYVIKNKYEQRNSLRVTLNQVQHEFNDNESLLERLNEFIQTMINQINEKAERITGFNFVMLEENLTNGGLTETCYVVDENGVPFKDINTARKVEMGIKFIEAVNRAMNNYNNLPILADRLEGIDDISKIATYTSRQIIGTKVSADGEINILSF